MTAPPPLPEALERALRERPWSVDFYQAVRLVDAHRRDLPPLGSAPRAGPEALRLGQDASLAFAPAAVSSFRAAGERPRIGVRFFGLFGPQGPLPLHLTDHAHERSLHHGDTTFAAFADLFHHRMLGLFYRAWASAQPSVDYDRPAQAMFPARLAALGGDLAGAAAAVGDSLPREALAYQAGVLAGNVRHAEGLTTIVHQHFGWPASVVPYTGHWLALADTERSRLGRGAALGAGAVAGSRAWDRQSRFTLRVGPLSHAQYASLLPVDRETPVLRRLRDWVRRAAGRDLAWTLQPVLAAADVPRARLGRQARLGWNTWLRGPAPSPVPRDDLHLDPERWLAPPDPIASGGPRA